MQKSHEIGVFVLLVSFLFVLPTTGFPSFLYVALTLYFVFITLAESWNLVGGFAGLLNLGHAAFFGIGVFAGGLAALNGLPIYLDMIIGGMAASLLALVTVPIFRVGKDYFALGTLVLPSVIRPTLEAVTGIHEIIIPRQLLLLFTVNYYVALVMMLSSSVALLVLVRSKFGYALRAMGDDQEVAQALGVNIFRFKLLSLIISGFIAGMAGAFYANYLGFISPSDAFGLTFTLTPIFMTLIGGIGTFKGPILGALVFAGVTQALAIFLPGSGVDLLLLAALIMGIAVLAPRGLVHVLEQSFFSKR